MTMIAIRSDSGERTNTRSEELHRELLAGEARATVALLGAEDFGYPRILSQRLVDAGFDIVGAKSSRPNPFFSPSMPDVVLVNLSIVSPADREQVFAVRSRFPGSIVCLLLDPDDQHVERLAQLPVDALFFKPVRIAELAIKLRILLWKRRHENHFPRVDWQHECPLPESGESGDAQGAMQDPVLRIDDREKIVIIQGRRVKLTPKEYKLLSLLASDPERVFSIEDIMAGVWSKSRRVAVADVQQYVCMLRKKIERNPSNPRFIKTVHGFGYKLVHSREG